MTNNPKINVKFDGKTNAEALADNAIQNFKIAFCKTQGCSFPEEINLNLFATKSEYENYFEANHVNPIKQAQHFTLAKSGDEFDVYSYLDRQKSEYSDLSIKRGVAHALIENNEKWGKVLPTSFKVGIADYVAGLDEYGFVQNNNDDKRDFEEIKKYSLHLNEILGNSKRGGVAEQAVKFLESRHGRDLDRLLHEIDNETVKEGRSSVNQFIEDMGEYNGEFSSWVADQLQDPYNFI
ncbi:MAG: hypothetical protein sL5_05940 [Candidatus Mesenet longicola]|uniref:Uncharacterized protein n=1 Tax=Candidatus Mesenet longicola TaxID=1892558 RepID=A0A8J3HPS5_9RICK|nr:MAG: hypothetical protein sGL2_06240 [Candidatus Mesenet longicola]GHM59601.1 MAG: hypothetical protein sL5_05940 [Candidatus Mesenet longicola]